MPAGFGPLATLTSSSGGDIGGGRYFTRLRGPILIGMGGGAQEVPATQGAVGNAYAGLTTQGPSIISMSTLRGDMLVSVVSSYAQSVVTASSQMNVSTGAPTGLVYISMSTGSGNMIAAASTANAPSGRPGGLNGVALCWDQAQATLAIYDPGTSAWLWPHNNWASSVAGAGASITWSASSS